MHFSYQYPFHFENLQMAWMRRVIEFKRNRAMLMKKKTVSTWRRKEARSFKLASVT